MYFTICHFQTLLDKKKGLFCVIFVYFDPNHLKSVILGTISPEISPKCIGVLFDGYVDHLTNGN